MAIIVKDLKKAYSDFTLRIDLEIQDGQTLVLAGPSGCGKTTALRAIAGLVRPDSGSIRLGGMDVGTKPTWQRGVGVVFQDHALFPHLSVGGNVGYGPFIRGISKKERKKIVQESLRSVRLESYEKRRIHTLSGGERQRVAIARALASAPQALLMDEPFSSLDAPLRRELRSEFKRIRAERPELPCLFVTHDREEAASLADRIALMRAGRIVEIGSPRDLFLSPRTAFTARFLGVGAVLPIQEVVFTENRASFISALGKLSLPVSGTESSNFQTPALLVPKNALSLVSVETATCRAIVTETVFEGERTSITVEIAGASLTLETVGRTERLDIGSIVGISIDEKALHLVEEAFME